MVGGAWFQTCANSNRNGGNRLFWTMRVKSPSPADNKINDKMIFIMTTPPQCSPARTLLNWTEQHLTDQTKVRNATIRNFEGKNLPLSETAAQRYLGMYPNMGVMAQALDGSVTMSLMSSQDFSFSNPAKSYLTSSFRQATASRQSVRHIAPRLAVISHPL